jgi:hypothetical protein
MKEYGFRLRDPITHEIKEEVWSISTPEARETIIRQYTSGGLLIERMEREKEAA